MPERDARTETFTLGAPLVVGAVTLSSVERTVVRARTSGAHAWLFVSREPYAIVVRDASGVRAIDAGAAGFCLETLREKLPELDAMLASAAPQDPSAIEGRDAPAGA